MPEAARYANQCDARANRGVPEAARYASHCDAMRTIEPLVEAAALTTATEAVAAANTAVSAAALATAQQTHDKERASEAKQKELKRKRAEEDSEYDGKVQTWQAMLAKQKENFARKAPKPITMRLTCTLCGNTVGVSSQEVEAWECHVKCGRRRANGV